MFLKNILLIILILVIGLMFFCLLCFIQRGWNESPMRDFIHNVMDYHVPDNHVDFDGASMHSKCKICNKRILQDSQGNWFSFTDDKEAPHESR